MNDAEQLWHQDLAAYLLGALDPEERAAFEDHLAGCGLCQAEAELLDPLPDIMSAIGAIGEPGAAVESAVGAVASLAGARRRGRGRAVGMAAVLAAAAVVAALAVTGVIPPAGRPAGQSQASAQSGGQSYGSAQGPWLTAEAAGGVTAAVMFRPMEWGTQLQARIAVAPGTRCQLEVVTSAGEVLPAGSWTADASAGRVWYPGSAQVPASGIRDFVITIGGGSQVIIPA